MPLRGAASDMILFCLQAAELEEFLFGTGADGLEGFGKESEHVFEDSVADLVNQVQQLNLPAVKPIKVLA